ncbi:MAG: ABC transporter ATP-binding protein [Candidatus Methylomirabilales bacterium]
MTRAVVEDHQPPLTSQGQKYQDGVLKVDVAAIKTEGLAKDYRVGFWRKKVRVLQDLSLEVYAGEIFGYLGPNGAGKTTTLKLLMGLALPTAGRAFILGRQLPDVKVKVEVGFLPENPYFYDYLTGREFLAFYGRLFGIRGRELEDRIASLLARVGLETSADLQLRKYSKGMLQRIGLAQALINDPKLVVLDEPMSGLDPIGRKEVRDLILKLKEEGKTIFFSSHIIPDVEMICDRVGILVGGRLVEVGKLEELLSAEIDSIEVTASGVNEAAREQVGRYALRPLVQIGEKVLIVIKDEESLAEVLRLLLEAKATLHAVSPHKRGLEELFLREVQGGGHR